MSVAGSVLIERASCRYRFPRNHPGPGELRLRLDGALRDRVPAVCGELLAESLPAGGGVAVIRRLDLKVVLSRRPASERRAAALWGRAIAMAVARVLAEDAPDRVVRFDSHAARVARLVEDIAWGTAWNRWYHAEFSSLSGLPASAAIRAALLLDRSAAGPALAELRRRGGGLRLVGDALTDADAWTIAGAVEATGAAPRLRDGAPHDLLRAAAAEARPALAALVLVAELAGGGGVAPADRELAIQLARVLPLLRDRPAAGWTARRLLDAATRAGDAELAGIRGLLAEAPELLLAAAEVAAAPPGMGAPAPTDEGEYELVTSYGGAFLLLPALVELDVEVEERLRAAARWAALVECVPADGRRAARHDPALAVAAGLEEVPDDAAVEAVARVGRRLAPRLLRRFAGRLPGFERSGRDHIARNFVVGPARVRVAPTGVAVTLPRVPLQVVLRIAGWRGSAHEVPWLPGAHLTVDDDDAE
jgi:hypothetical protein